MVLSLGLAKRHKTKGRTLLAREVDHHSSALLVYSWRRMKKGRTLLCLSIHQLCSWSTLLANMSTGGKPSAVLAFGVDHKVISTIALPPAVHVPSWLMEIRIRLCVCMRDGGKQNVLVWSLMPAGSSHHWDQLCASSPTSEAMVLCEAELCTALGTAASFFFQRLNLLHVQSLRSL